MWQFETVDTATSVGEFCSLRLGLDGRPRIAYYAASPSFELRFATKTASTWTIEVVDPAPFVGQWSALAIDAAGNPHISYFDDSNDDLKYATKQGGIWTIEAVALTGPFSHTSIAVDSRGRPHVSYHDPNVGNLKYAVRLSGAWIIQNVFTAANFGQWSSITVDRADRAHISSHAYATNDLHYFTQAGSGDFGLQIISAGSVGGYTSLVLDQDANPSISFYGLDNTALRLARKVGSAWITEDIDVPGTVGKSTSLARDAEGNLSLSYFDESNGDLKFGTSRLTFISPTAGSAWPVGSQQTVAWRGVGPVGVSISTDGGGSFIPLLSALDGNAVPLRVPHLPTRFARLRLARESGLIATTESDSFFTIDATIALAKFDARVVDVLPVINIWDDGSGFGRPRENKAVHVTWETRPGVEADIRYRVERDSDGDAVFRPIHGGLLDKIERYDRDGVLLSASRYRLIAVNGLGEEYVLGETNVTGALAADRDIVAYPNPASGPIEILYRVPDSRDVELAVYDVSGRRVRSVASGRFQVGVQSATWDGRNDSGVPVAAGTYFARLTWNGVANATERVTIVR